MHDLNLISVNDIDIENIDPKEILYTYNPKIGQAKVNEYLFRGNSTFILINFSTNARKYDKLLNTIKSILCSFRFLTTSSGHLDIVYKIIYI